MEILSRIFGSGDDSDETRPPKPDREEKSFTKELTRHEVTVEYLNGDTETFEAFNVYSRDGNTITFNVSADPRRSFDGGVSFSYNRRTENYDVLAREPVMEPLEKVEYRVSWTVDYEWKRGRTHYSPKSWQETAIADTIELEEVSE